MANQFNNYFTTNADNINDEWDTVYIKILLIETIHFFKMITVITFFTLIGYY